MQKRRSDEATERRRGKRAWRPARRPALRRLVAPSRRRFPHPPAYTLVEMVAVVAIVAVLAAMVVPQLSASVGSARLRSAATRLLVAMRFAHDHAVTHGRACRVVLDRREHRFGVECQADPEHRPEVYEPLPAAGLKPSGLGAGVRIASVRVADADAESDASAAVLFKPGGGATAAVIELTDGARVFAIVVEPAAGRARLLEGSVPRLPEDREDLDA